MHQRFPILGTVVAAAVLVVATSRPVDAQELPVLDAAHTNLILQEVSGDAAYEHIRFMTQFHRPGGGSNGLWQVAEYVADKARALGLGDVQIIKQPATSRPWNAEFADLWITGDQPERIASTLQNVLHLADYSRPADVRGALIDLGPGTDADYDGKALTGKVILTYGSSSRAMRRGVCEGGALGVVWYPSPFSPDLGTQGAGLSRPDQLRWTRVSTADTAGGCEPTWQFSVSARQGVALRNRLQQSDEPVEVHALVRSAFDSDQGAEPWMVMVEAFLPGTDPAAGQDIVLTGHLQEEGFSANDDASGSASMLEIARALSALIESGRIPRPTRNVRFWWVTEISSQRQYFADNPEAHHTMWVNVNQDMVGADQSQDILRKQNITRVPASRFHFFNDVVESVVEFMVAGNTYELAQAQAGTLLYPNPHMAHLGSMHRYNAEMIYFHANSDHMTFFEAPIGIPAVSFTNMPDRYIHSSDDDLWNIDRTQLGRSAAAVALIAYAMADLDADDTPVLTAMTTGRGVQRMGRNLELALTWIAQERDTDAAYHHAVDQLWYASMREKLAARSLTDVAASASRVQAVEASLDRMHEQMQVQVDAAYRAATGANPPTRRGQTDAEASLADMRPALIAGPTEFRERRDRLRSASGLHSLMGMEVMQAIDGERSGWDIYRFVAAEAREAGAHYYGVVTPEAVLAYLQIAVDAELIRGQ
jgi:hypothetical protein